MKNTVFCFLGKWTRISKNFVKIKGDSNVWQNLGANTLKGDPKSKYKLAEIYAFEGVDSEFHISFLSFDL